MKKPGWQPPRNTPALERFPAGRRRRGGWFSILLVLLLVAAAPWQLSGAELTLNNGRPACEPFNCDVLSQEFDGFRQHPKAGLPVLEALKGGKIAAYLFLSTDLTKIPAYSCKPLVTLIVMDPQGTILEAKVVHHSEPILLVGIPESVLNEFAAQFVGRNILAETRIASGAKNQPASRIQTEPSEASNDTAPYKVHMITGATVTALVLEETLFTSARVVGRGLGLIKEVAHGKVTWKADYVPKSWAELVEEGSIGHLRIEARQMDPTNTGNQPWLDLYFGDLTLPVVGRNVLGKIGFRWLQNRIKDGERALFIVSNGIGSFKGSGFVRGGIFDRFHITQGLNKFTFRDLDYENLYGIKAKDAPRFRESGIFFLRHERFDPVLPYVFTYLGSRLTGETATSKSFKRFNTPFKIPGKYFQMAAIPGNKRPSLIQRIWKERLTGVIFLIVFLLATMGVFFARRVFTASARRLNWTHMAVLAGSVVGLGLVLKTTPSVTQLYPLLRMSIEEIPFDLFLADPLLFIFWIFIAVSLMLWGRGWFCGWVCPYGALLELVHRLSRMFLPKKAKYEFPDRIHNLLIRLRYVILGLLLGLSLFSLEWAERLAEVEPFKTTWIVGVFNREWYFSVYWWALLIISMFNFRFFCRYLCPLGAALSLGTVGRLIGIKRREFCNQCKICSRGCESRAIDNNGQINRFECLYCLECEQKYHDDMVCPPLVVVRRKAEKLAKAQTETPSTLPEVMEGVQSFAPEKMGGGTA